VAKVEKHQGLHCYGVEAFRVAVARPFAVKFVVLAFEFAALVSSIGKRSGLSTFTPERGTKRKSLALSDTSATYSSSVSSESPALSSPASQRSVASVNSSRSAGLGGLSAHESPSGSGLFRTMSSGSTLGLEA
jgi:hypothetical protein